MSELRDRPALTVLPIRVLLSALVLFTIVALVATSNDVVPGDEVVLDAVQALPSFPFEPILHIGNLIGETIAGPIAAVVLGILCGVRRFVPGIVFCASLLAFRVGGMFLKRVFDSPRPGPEHADIRGHFDGLGFPSGHMLTAGCIAMASAIVLPALLRDGATLRVVLGVVWTLSGLCGVARIWYGAHWPTDVIGGAAAAVAMAWVSLWFAGIYQDRTRNHRTPATSAAAAPHRSTTSR